MTPKKRLLSGLNLIRPLGPELSGLTSPQVVRDMAYINLGALTWWDPNLQVPGSNVIPIVAIEPIEGYVFGQNYVLLNLDDQGLSLDQHSPLPASLEHVTLNHAQCQQVDHWSLFDPNLLNVEIPALKKTVGGGVDKTYEGCLALFADLTGIDAIGMVVDAEPIVGGGSAITVVRLKDFMDHPTVVEAFK
jgi:hypothetical protein